MHVIITDDEGKVKHAEIKQSEEVTLVVVDGKQFVVTATSGNSLEIKEDKKCQYSAH